MQIGTIRTETETETEPVRRVLSLKAISSKEMVDSPLFSEAEKVLIREAQREFKGAQDAELAYILVCVIRPAIVREGAGADEQLYEWDEAISLFVTEEYIEWAEDWRVLRSVSCGARAGYAEVREELSEGASEAMDEFSREVDELHDEVNAFREARTQSIDGITQRIQELMERHAGALKKFESIGKRAASEGKKLVAVDAQLKEMLARARRRK